MDHLESFRHHLSRGDTSRARESWCLYRDQVSSDTLDHVDKYWNSTGDPLGSLEILCDVPSFSDDNEVLADRYISTAQDIVDDMERECLWDRVYPPDFPIGARWKEGNFHPVISCGRDVWPALLVDRDDERVMFRIGEWKNGPPASREIIMSSGFMSRSDLKPGDYVQALCVRGSGDLIGVERQITPPAANLADTRAAVRRLWDALPCTPLSGPMELMSTARATRSSVALE